MDCITVTVKKDLLLETLKRNRAKHQKEHAAAHAAWLLAVIARLGEMHFNARTKKVIEQFVGLDEPRTYVKEYDRAIGMLEWHTGETVLLTPTQYTQFVEDEWNWKRDFVGVASRYVASTSE
jgi:hypothetical protein